MVSFQLLSDLLAPVSEQVSEHISDYSNMLSFRAHIKKSISSSSQVSAVPPPIVSSLTLTSSSPLFFSMCQVFPSSLLASEFSLTFSPPARPRSEGCEVKGQGENEARRLNHSLVVVKRKWRRTEEDADKGVRERSADHKRSKSGEHRRAHAHSVCWKHTRLTLHLMICPCRASRGDSLIDSWGR